MWVMGAWKVSRYGEYVGTYGLYICTLYKRTAFLGKVALVNSVGWVCVTGVGVDVVTGIGVGVDICVAADGNAGSDTGVGVGVGVVVGICVGAGVGACVGIDVDTGVDVTIICASVGMYMDTGACCGVVVNICVYVYCCCDAIRGKS